MDQQFSPITLGQRLLTFNAGGFVLTETIHRPEQKLPRHLHELTNLAFVVAGSFTEILDRRSIECDRQSVLIKPPGEAHANRYGRSGMRCLLVEITPPQLDDLHPCSGALAEVRHVRGGLLSMLGTRIYNEFRLRDETSSLAIEGLMLEALASLARQHNTRSMRGRPRWLSQVKEILHAEFHNRVSLAGVAATVGIHPVQLARAFRRSFGCTPGDYVRQLRIDFARRELSDSDKPIVEIALAAGFAHQAHFSRVFKAQTGLTPKEFREAHRRR
ncbi:MAG TPA: AraC family transcriptional regulator [Pyrinomonadaceae bacterium]